MMELDYNDLGIADNTIVVFTSISTTTAT